MTGVIVLLLLVAAVVALVLAQRRAKARELERQEAELAPVRQLTFEDVTALGEQLRQLDVELAGRQLSEGEHADYQRALDAYEAAKSAADAITRPDDVRHVTQILDDGRYAMACVRARVAGEPLPVRRPACFFDPRHGTAVTDVLWAPPGGAPRDVPACALDAERVSAGADPDSRMVMAGARRVPYYQAGPAYAPYAAGTFGGLGPILFTGLLFGGLGGFDMVGDGFDAIGDGVGEIGDGVGEIGDGIGDAFGDFGGFDF
jgi:hypothetical protein